MSKHEPTRIELTEKQSEQVNEASHDEDSFLGRITTQLEGRYTPLVVIAIIAILIGMLLPAVW
ncbi:MAG: hypothetical protein ACREBE_17000 [bacterium]